jgi:hypothetical protein
MRAVPPGEGPHWHLWCEDLASLRFWDDVTLSPPTEDEDVGDDDADASGSPHSPDPEDADEVAQ